MEIFSVCAFVCVYSSCTCNECIRLQIWHHRVDEHASLDILGEREEERKEKKQKLPVMIMLHNPAELLFQQREMWPASGSLSETLKIISQQCPLVNGLSIKAHSSSNWTLSLTRSHFKDSAWGSAFKWNPSKISKLAKRSSDQIWIMSDLRRFDIRVNQCVSAQPQTTRSPIGGRSCADYHYIRTWFRDYGAHNRLYWAHNYRNQQLPLRGW